MAATRQRRVGRLLMLVTVGLLLVNGRTMLSLILLMPGPTNDDWSAACSLSSRGQVDLEILRREVVARCLASACARRPLMTVLEGIQVPRTDKRMPGSGFLRPLPPPPGRAKLLSGGLDPE